MHRIKTNQKKNKKKRTNENRKRPSSKRFSHKRNRIGGVMVSVLASSAVDRGFEPRSSQTGQRL